MICGTGPTSTGLMRPADVTEIHVYRVILQSSRDQNACTRSVTRTGPMSDPFQTLKRIIDEWWDLELDKRDAISGEQCPHVVLDQ